MYQRISRTTALLALAAASLALVGCSSVKRQQYMNHVNATVKAGDAADDALAIAFGLDEYATDDSAVAIASER